MRSTALGTLALALPGAGAHAAEPLPYSWTGFYTGLNAGYAWGNNTPICSVVPGATSPCNGLAIPTENSQGGIFGIEVGANWQYQNWVVGAAADWSVTDLHDSYSFPSVDAGKSDALSSRYDWLGTARGRLGYVAGQSLFYGTGGLAVGRVKHEFDNDFNSTTGSAQSFVTTGTMAGWTAGAGWEYMINRNLSVKAEYLHVDLGKSQLDISASPTNANFGAGAAPGTSILHFNNTFDIVRAGINLRW